MNVNQLVAGLNLSAAQLNQLEKNLTAIRGSELEGLAADVARAKDGSLMTRHGFDVLAKACAGKQLKYTRAALGDSLRNGEILNPTDEQILELNDLIHWRQDIPIADVRFAGGGTMVVQTVLNNADFRAGFWCRELGLFAEDPDTHEEVLYSYRNSGLLSSYAPAGDGAVLINLIFNLVTVVDNATNVVAVVDTNLLFVSQAQLTSHVNALNPHPNIPQVSNELQAAPFIWTNDADNHLHPITVLNLARQILGDDAEQLSTLKGRVDQTELNVANLYMQLVSRNELGLEANLLIFEDFVDNRCVDMLKVKVLNTVGGPNDVYVESLDGILIGHYYTLSDGSRSQQVLVTAVATNAGLQNVMFSEPLTKTFNLKKTYLYRTTGFVLNGAMNGSSATTETRLAPDEVWRGVRASVTSTVALTTTQKNAANFDLSGDYSFDNDGFFTVA